MASIKNEEFINIVNSTLLAGKSLLKKINSDEYFFDKLLDIRSLHGKLEKELEEFITYPNYEYYCEQNNLPDPKIKVRDICMEIQSISKEIGVKVVFTKRDTLEFNKRIFAYYTLEDTPINGLIYYNRKTKTYVEDISNLELD